MLNQRGYRTRRGKEFSGTTIGGMIADPTPKGLHRANFTTRDENANRLVLKPESEWVYQPVEAILSAELWNECARILSEQSATRKPPAKRAVNLFAGFTYCACGERMYVRSNTPKYVCEACRNKIPISDLEAIYRTQLHHFLVAPEEIEAHDQAARDAIRDKEKLIETIQAELKKLEANDDELFDLYREKLISKDDFVRRHRPLSDRRAQIEDEVPRLQAECDVLRISTYSRTEALGEARTLTERWQELPESQKRQIVEAITERIVIDRDGIEIRLLQLSQFQEHVANERSRPGGSCFHTLAP